MSRWIWIGVAAAMLAIAAPLPAHTPRVKDGRKDSVPDHAIDQQDEYLEGYVQALLDMHYYEYQVRVEVINRRAILFNLPNNKLLASSITAFVEDFPGIDCVEVACGALPDDLPDSPTSDRIGGIWMPQSTLLFAPLVADPRMVTYSAGLRYGDRLFCNHALFQATFGDDFPIYRWPNVCLFGVVGDVQLDIEGCVFSIFDWKSDRFDLINADYYVALPLTYAHEAMAYRLRFYHISSHVGDGWIFHCNHKWRYHRRSQEALDLVASYQLTNEIRLYGGPGAVLHSDSMFTIAPWYIIYGFELRILGHRSTCHQLYGQPVLAAYITNTQDHHWNMDANYLLGYEWSKLQGVGRKLRIAVEYHDGYSQDGQWAKKRTNYTTFRFSYGF
jgi:hypothetical protein